jgi:hypothetical protein
MRQPAASLIRRGRIDRRIPDLHERNLPFHIDHEGYAVRHPVGTQYAIFLSCGSVSEIAEQGERKLQLIGKYFLGRTIIFADAKNFCIFTFEFCDTSLVRGKFLCSATGECGGKKRQHHGILSFEIAQRDFAAHGTGERKVRRDIAHFEGCRIAGLLSHQDSASGESQSGNGVKPHGKTPCPA